MTTWNAGSQWQRWDPHIHAPGTLRNNQFGEDWDGYVAAIEAARPSPVALGITDYFTMRGYERVLALRADGRLASVPFVFANIEIRLTIETRQRQGINLHLLVSPEDPHHVRLMKEKLARLSFRYRGQPYPCTDEGLIRLGREHANDDSLAEGAALREGANQFKVELGALHELFEGDQWIRGNVLYAVAAGNDGLSGISEDASFHGQRQELGRLAHIVFSGNPQDRKYWLGQHRNFQRDGQTPKPCIHGCDAHEVARVLRPAAERRTWIRGAPSFDALRQTLVEPERRVHIGPDAPSGPSPSNVIRRVRFTGADWLEPVALDLNDGLVTIIGARGSGKTALADLIALAADAGDETPGPASFVRRAADLLRDVEVEIEWGDGVVQRRSLTDECEEPRVRYLSQQFVERLSQRNATVHDRDDYGHFGNDGGEPAPDELLAEIERVVFAAIAVEDRMGCETFAELRNLKLGAHLTERASSRDAIQDQTEIVGAEREIRKRQGKIEAAAREATRTKQALEDDLKAIPIKAPAEHVQTHAAATARLKALQDAIAKESARAHSIEQIGCEVRRQLRTAEHAHAELRGRFPGVLADADWAKLRLRADDAALDNLAAMTVASKGRERALREHGIAATAPADGTPSAGIVALTEAVEAARKTLGEDGAQAMRRADLTKKLDAAKLAEEKQQKAVAHAQGATARMEAAHTLRLDAYERIFETLDAEVTTLRSLYEPLRLRLAADPRLSALSFRVSRHVDLDAWVSTAESSIFDLRKPPFLGRGSLKTAAGDLDRAWRTANPAGVRAALLQFAAHHVEPAMTALRNGVSGRDVGAWLFSTDHVAIRYGIEFEGVDIRNLSPGTRGVVLLTLFLAIDQHDLRPLVIDQPEENLDPKSVQGALVPFFRDAARRRQIIMVTHNANLVVNADADQVIVAEAHHAEPTALPKITYSAGGLEEERVRHMVCQYLEGGDDAFRRRSQRYGLVALKEAAWTTRT